ncbi:MAG: DUF2384 domain-containing protein, partial [Parvularculaceae bacterium]|nr:DUF2384 domain-containing protein [Parvularculaceae bacterium]
MTNFALIDAVENAVFSPDAIASGLRTTKAELTETLGLASDALTRRQRIEASKTQTRLREMIEILRRVEGLVGSSLAAYAWFRSEPLVGFARQTPSQLVREGRARDVHAYL